MAQPLERRPRNVSRRSSSIGPVWVATRSGSSGFGAGGADAAMAASDAALYASMTACLCAASASSAVLDVVVDAVDVVVAPSASSDPASSPHPASRATRTSPTPRRSLGRRRLTTPTLPSSCREHHRERPAHCDRRRKSDLLLAATARRERSHQRSDAGPPPQRQYDVEAVPSSSQSHDAGQAYVTETHPAYQPRPREHRGRNDCGQSGTH